MSALRDCYAGKRGVLSGMRMVDDTPSSGGPGGRGRAYLTFVPAAVLLFLPAFRNRRFVRFHAWQSVLLWGVFRAF